MITYLVPRLKMKALHILLRKPFHKQAITYYLYCCWLIFRAYFHSRRTFKTQRGDNYVYEAQSENVNYLTRVASHTSVLLDY